MCMCRHVSVENLIAFLSCSIPNVFGQATACFTHSSFLDGCEHLQRILARTDTDEPTVNASDVLAVTISITCQLHADRCFRSSGYRVQNSLRPTKQ